jgi:GGDEF domain-containing protein
MSAHGGDADLCSSDPGARLREHDRLLDLERALEDKTLSTLAVFALIGAEAQRVEHGAAANDEVLSHVATIFARLVGPRARCYRARRDELCLLLPEDTPHAVAEILFEAERVLDEAASPYGIAATFGAAFLDEVEDAIELLILPDERLRSRNANRDGRERRTGR